MIIKLVKKLVISFYQKIKKITKPLQNHSKKSNLQFLEDYHKFHKKKKIKIKLMDDEDNTFHDFNLNENINTEDHPRIDEIYEKNLEVNKIFFLIKIKYIQKAKKMIYLM